ncbi:MAG: glycosyltransferase family 4 protein, partial [Blastocatellia bacterium]
MKVLIVTDAWLPQVNGVVTTLRKMQEGLSELGHDVRFVTPQGFRSIACPTYPEIRLSLLPYGGVSREIETFSPDAIHIATEGPLGSAARRYCLKRGLSFTSAFHTRFAEYVHARTRIPLGLTYGWLRRFHAPSRALMVPTPAVRRELEARGFGNTVAWTRGVDTVTFSAGERNRLETEPPIFLYVGRVAVEKNIEAFLKIELPGSKWVVGEGPMRAQLERKYPEVYFAGIKTPAELATYYRAADVFVFPSLTDTFGLVMLESLACGTPVAAYPV